MIPPEADTQPLPDSSRQLFSHANSNLTSSTGMPLSRMQSGTVASLLLSLSLPGISENGPPSMRSSIVSAKISSPTVVSGGMTTPRFSQPLVIPKTASGRPRRYAPGLTPLPSVMRPHCLARDRLKRCFPEKSRRPVGLNGEPLPFSEEDLQRVLTALSFAWAEKTLESYGSGLLVFHVFCDNRGVPEASRAPAARPLLELFVSCLIGSYSMSAVSNYMSGVHAWHSLHGLAWPLDAATTQLLLRAADRLAPPSRGKREPLTVDFMERLRPALDISVSLDAAVWAALLVIFWSTSRCGEFLLPRLDAFDPQLHIQTQHYTTSTQGTVLVHNFHLPWTKTRKLAGDDVFFAGQTGPCDPVAALCAHLELNKPAPDAPLFEHVVRGKRRPLTVSAMRHRLKSAAASLNLVMPPGHSARIGSLLWYLLNGMPFREAMAKGRWQSTSSFHLSKLFQHRQLTRMP